MPLILTKRKINEIVNRAIKRAMSYFALREFDGIKIEVTYLPKIKMTFDREKREIKIQIGRLSTLSPSEIETILTYLLAKNIAYRQYCPYDVKTAAEIIKQSVMPTGYPIGLIASGMLIELINDCYLLHRDPDLVIEAYQILKKMLGDTSSLLVGLQYALINHIYGQEVFKIEDESLRTVAEELYYIVFRRNISNPLVWPSIAREISRYLMKILEGVDVEKEMKELGEAFRYNIMREFMPMLSLQSSGERETMVASFRAMYGIIRGDLSASAPLILSTVSLKPKEIMRLWYRERAKELVRITIKEKIKVIRHKIEYPDTWSLGDSIEELDVYLSSNISPIMIPGYTTKKWKTGKSAPQRIIRRTPDILLVIDSSGSMGKLHGYKEPEISREMRKIMKKLRITYVLGSKFDVALLASFGILEYALNIGCSVAAVNFSNVPIYTGFTMNRTKLEDVLMIHQNGGTYFPVKTIKKLLSGRRDVLVIVISDAAIYNRKTAGKFLEKVSREHTLYFFHIELPAKYGVLEKVRSAGGYVINISDPSELPKLVLTLAEKHTRWRMISE